MFVEQWCGICYVDYVELVVGDCGCWCCGGGYYGCFFDMVNVGR